jgi:hypothetical protein
MIFWPSRKEKLRGAKRWRYTLGGIEFKCHLPWKDVASMLQAATHTQRAIKAATGRHIPKNTLKMGRDKRGSFLAIELPLTMDQIREIQENLENQGWKQTKTKT